MAVERWMDGGCKQNGDQFFGKLIKKRKIINKNELYIDIRTRLTLCL